MDTPGNVLKSERERQKKPLKEVARKLKINIQYLEAIEDDDYAVLPAEVFARSYIRLYADELALDSSKLLELFGNILNEPAVEEPKIQEQETVQPPSADTQKKSFRPFLIIAAAGLLILIFVLMSQKKEQEPVETASLGNKAAVHETKQADIKKERSPAEALPTEKKAPDKAVKQTPAPDKKKPADKAASGTGYKKTAGEMTLKIVATELTWVSLSIDGGKPREWQLRSGQTITLNGQNGFSGKIGNAGGTRLYLNNKDIGELGPHGKIIDIDLPR